VPQILPRHPHLKSVYQNRLRVPEYYWFDPFNPEDWAGFELHGRIYEQNLHEAQNSLVSQFLGLALTRWHGIYEDTEAVWLRWETLQGTLLPTPQEARDAEKQRANCSLKSIISQERLKFRSPRFILDVQDKSYFKSLSPLRCHCLKLEVKAIKSFSSTRFWRLV